MTGAVQGCASGACFASHLTEVELWLVGLEAAEVHGGR